MIETKTKSLPSGDAPRSLRSGRQTQVLRLAQDDKTGSFPSGDGRSGVILRSGFGDEGSGLDSEGLKTRSLPSGDAAQLLRSGRPEA